ncbi:hypothetical protein V8G54_035101 [Vigna mungo]|uniref:Uncharacterized protein n=1 Tax=Vigna mungo TaxID=3915 RepID=A0AAQ3MEG2_VIGMU
MTHQINNGFESSLIVVEALALWSPTINKARIIAPNAQSLLGVFCSIQNLKKQMASGGSKLIEVQVAHLEVKVFPQMLKTNVGCCLLAAAKGSSLGDSDDAGKSPRQEESQNFIEYFKQRGVSNQSTVNAIFEKSEGGCVKPAMGFIHEEMDKAKEKIQSLLNGVSKRLTGKIDTTSKIDAQIEDFKRKHRSFGSITSQHALKSKTAA